LILSPSTVSERGVLGSTCFVGGLVSFLHSYVCSRWEGGVCREEIEKGKRSSADCRIVLGDPSIGVYIAPTYPHFTSLFGHDINNVVWLDLMVTICPFYYQRKETKKKEKRGRQR
jgi:hypothetical protein